MKRRQHRATFFGEIAFAFLGSLIAAALAVTLSYVAPAAIVARAVVAGLGFTLVLRAVARSDEKTGRIVALAVWLAAAAAVWLTGIALPGYIAVHLTLVWLARTLFGYSRLIEAGLELGLSWLAICIATLAAIRTESVFLSVWCFLFVLAFAVAIPATASRLTTPRRTGVTEGDPNRAFSDAFAAADAAVQRLAARR